VSGARGKLGGEVCRQLRVEGHEVVEADVAAPTPLDPAVSGGADPVGSRGVDAAVSGGVDSAGVVDLRDRGAVAASLGGVDAVVHCAGIASPENIEPVRLLEANAITTFNALEEAWRLGIRTAVLASSGSIYGTAWSPEPIAQPYVPVDEDSPLQYVDPYALTKDVLERMGQMYARRGMTVTALRFHWILTGAEVREVVDALPEGEGVRDLWGYVDLEDAGRACLLALLPGEGRERYEVLLIASDETRVVRPIDELLAEHCPDTELRVPLAGAMGAFDCSRAQRVIGWAPRSRWREA
jgi:nucleoside-diphosphate-sugar epimerase